jgi:hypothetical protein
VVHCALLLRAVTVQPDGFPLTHALRLVAQMSSPPLQGPVVQVVTQAPPRHCSVLVHASAVWVPHVPLLLQTPRMAFRPPESQRVDRSQSQQAVLGMHWPLQIFVPLGIAQRPPAAVHCSQVPQVSTQQRPFVQRPDSHWEGLLQLEPAASSAVQVPFMQRRPLPLGQLSPAQQLWPLAPQAVQVPFRHSRPLPQLTLFWARQVPVLHSWQSALQSLLQHLPSTQLPDWHWPGAVQLVPLPASMRHTFP